jgi:hypothetical protein
VEDLKDPLIGNLVCACQIRDTFTSGVSGAYLFVPFQLGEVLWENWFGGTGNAVIEESSARWIGVFMEGLRVMSNPDRVINLKT